MTKSIGRAMAEVLETREKQSKQMIEIVESMKEEAIQDLNRRLFNPQPK